MTLTTRQEEMRQRMRRVSGQYSPPRYRRNPKQVPVPAEQTIAIARVFLTVPAPFLPPERVDISRRLLAELIALAEVGLQAKANEG